MKIRINGSSPIVFTVNIKALKFLIGLVILDIMGVLLLIFGLSFLGEVISYLMTTLIICHLMCTVIYLSMEPMFESIKEARKNEPTNGILYLMFYPLEVIADSTLLRREKGAVKMIKLLTFQPKRVLRLAQNGGYEVENYSILVNQCGNPPYELEKEFLFKPIFVVELTDNLDDLFWRLPLLYASMPQTMMVLEVPEDAVRRFDYFSYLSSLKNGTTMDWNRDTEYQECVIPYIKGDMIISSCTVYERTDDYIHTAFQNFINNEVFILELLERGVSGRVPVDILSLSIETREKLVEYFELFHKSPEKVTTDDVKRYKDYYFENCYKEL